MAQNTLSWSSRYPISAAACSQDASTLKQLLYASGTGALTVSSDALNQLDEEGRSALHYAAWNGLVATAAVLLEAGADVNIQTPDRGATPLHFACGMGHPEVARLLLQHKADRKAVDVDRWTPLVLARQNLFNHSAAVVAELERLLEEQ